MISKILFSLLISIFVIAKSQAIDPVSKIAKANEAKSLANEAYKNGDYKEAVKQYSYLLDTLNYSSEAAQLNKAHSLFFLKDTINAFDNYRALSTAENNKIRSTSFLQMGNLAEQQKEYENALAYFKEALKSDPTNQDARYNYELLKKKMQQQEEEQQDQNSDKDKQDQEKQKDSEEKESEDKNSEGDDSDESQEGEDTEKSKEEQEAEDQKKNEEAEQEQQNEDKPSEEDGDKQEQQQQKEGEEGKEEEQPPMQPSTKEKLEQMNISEEKAKMLLEALRNKEAQYFQQMRKKATERPKSGKPDW